MKEYIAMDFDKLIRDLVKSGADIEDLADEFTKALNKAQAANKSKKMVNDYTSNLRAEAYREIGQDKMTFATAAKIATVVAARKYEKLDLETLKQYCDATEAAIGATSEFQAATKCEGKSILEALFDALPSEKKESKTDEEKIADFLRKLG